MASTNFSKNTIEFIAIPASKVILPESSRSLKLFLDVDGKLKTISYSGEVAEIGGNNVTNITNETIVAYDDSVLKTQLVSLTESLKVFATSEALANDIAILTKIIDQNKNDTLAAYINYVEELSRFVSKTEAALRATDVATTQLQADLQAARENQLYELGKLQELVSLISSSLVTLTSDVSRNIQLINKSLDSKADRIALINLEKQIPVVESGSPNVIVEKSGNTYTVAVTGVDRVIEKVIERSVGGGTSRATVQSMIDKSLEGYTPGAGGATTFVNGLSGEIEIIGSNAVTVATCGQQIIIDAATILASGNTILSGIVPLSAGVTEYTIPHIQLDPTAGVPVVAIESDSNFYRWRIFDRLTVSFKVALDAAPVDGESLLYHLTFSPFLEDYWVTEDPEFFVVDEFDNRIAINA